MGKKTPWLIGIRLRGNLRRDVRNYMNDVKRAFLDKRKSFPHITMFGPFSTRLRRQHLVSIILKNCIKYSDARYSTDGFSSFDHGGWFRKGRGVIFVKINPNEKLKNLRYDIAKQLLPYSETVEFDRHDTNKFVFHCTLAIGQTDTRFKNINKTLESYKLKYENITPEMILYYDSTPVFSCMVGGNATILRPRNLYLEPKQYSIGLPFAPPYLNVNSNNCQAILSWRPPKSVHKIICYKIEYGYNNIKKQFFHNSDKPLTCKISNLEDGVRYFFRVSAVNYIGIGNPSRTVYVISKCT